MLNTCYITLYQVIKYFEIPRSILRNVYMLIVSLISHTRLKILKIDYESIMINKLQELQDKNIHHKVHKISGHTVCGRTTPLRDRTVGSLC